MRQQHTRFRVIALVAALLAPALASAQSAPSLFAASLDAVAAQAASQPGGGDIVRRISIDDAVKLALEENLGIKIQRIDPQIQDMGIAQAQASWRPNFTTGLQRNSQVQQSTNVLSGGTTSIDNGTFSTQIGVNQTLPWGGSYTGTFNNSRFTTSNLYQSFYSPQLGSSVNLQYTQPLMRNFSMDQIRQQVASSKKTRDLSDIQLQAVVTGTLRSVKNAYWDLVYSIDNLKAQQQSLALSQQFLKDNQKRVEIGTLAPIDIVQAQAEVAANEQGVIVADATIKSAQDALRTLVLDPSAPDFWNVSFEPSDAASFADRAIDADAAVRNALDKRSDLHAAKNSVEQSDINMQFFNNQIKPDVNAQVTYLTTAVGGVPQAAQTTLVDRSYGTVLGDVFKNSFPSWTVGLQIGYPLGLNTAHANLARAKLQYDQSQAQLKNLQMQVAAQVRMAARNVQTNQKRVQSARASRELQEKKLEAEEKKLAAGMSQSFFVFQAQRDLALARTAEIQAIADYNKSLVDFEAVQEVPLNGGSAPLTIAGR